MFPHDDKENCPKQICAHIVKPSLRLKRPLRFDKLPHLRVGGWNHESFFWHYLQSNCKTLQSRSAMKKKTFCTSISSVVFSLGSTVAWWLRCQWPLSGCENQKFSPNRLPQQASASRRLLARLFMVNFWGDHLPKYYVYIIYVCCSWGYFITWLKHIWVNALLVSPCSASEMSAFFARPICSLIRCSMVFPDYFSVAMFFFTNFVRTSRWFWEWGPWKHFLFHQHHVWYWVNLRKWWCFAIAITVWSLDIQDMFQCMEPNGKSSLVLLWPPRCKYAKKKFSISKMFL